MSSILLLLEDGEMHNLIQGGVAGNGGNGGLGQIVLARNPDDPNGEHTSISLSDAVISDSDAFASFGGGGGPHFLSADSLTKDADGNYVTKIELENVPYEVIVEKSDAASLMAGGSSSSYSLAPSMLSSLTPVPPTTTSPKKKGKKANQFKEDRKVCQWVNDNGTTCGKAFAKMDSLKRHMAEAHKGVRPFTCNICGKSYGRKDYLQRHMKSHMTPVSSLTPTMTTMASPDSVVVTSMQQTEVTKPIYVKCETGMQHVVKQEPMQQQQQQPTIVIESGQSGPQTVKLMQQAPMATSTPMASTSNHPSVVKSIPAPNAIPFLNLTGQLPMAKPMGSKICRWVQNDGTVCGKAFSKLDSLRRHVNELHKGVRPHSCHLCDKNYGRRDYLDRHMRTHQRKKKAEGSVGPESGVLMSGDEESTPPKPKIPKKKRKDIPPEEKKICLWILEDGTACGKTFTKFDSLKRHVSEGHKNIRPYSCSICGKDYGRRDYLLRHLKSHNEIEVSNIKIDKVRNNPSNHPANNVNSLNMSGNSVGSPASPNSSSLLPAINFSQIQPQPPSELSGIIASDLPPVKVLAPPLSMTNSITSPIFKRKGKEDKKTCKWVLDDGTVCGKTFSKFDSLRRHVTEMHKNIRPFVCEICNKSYGRKDYLDRHMKSHENPLDSLMTSPHIISTGIEESENDDIMTTTVVVDTGMNGLDDDDDDSDCGLPTVVTVVSNNDL